MKKTFFAFGLLLLLLMTSCDLYVSVQPWNYSNTVWVCKNPKITYYVPEEEKAEDYAIAEMDGETIKLFFGFRGTQLSAVVTNAEGVDEECFFGSCQYAEKQFTVTVDKKTDKLFNGQYDILVFERIE